MESHFLICTFEFSVMKKIPFFICCTCLAFNSAAFTTLGVPSCIDWNSTRQKSNFGKNLNADFQSLIAELSNQSFVIGYMNAFATHLSLSQNVDILKSITKEKILEMVDVECQSKPNQTVADSSLIVVLKRLAGK
jgi:hypothetical protein